MCLALLGYAHGEFLLETPPVRRDRPPCGWAAGSAASVPPGACTPTHVAAAPASPASRPSTAPPRVRSTAPREGRILQAPRAARLSALEKGAGAVPSGHGAHPELLPARRGCSGEP